MGTDMVEEMSFEHSLDQVFQKADEINIALEKSEKPRQRAILGILRKHNLPAFIGPFFDVYFRIAAKGGDMEKVSLLVVTRLSAYLKEDAAEVGRRHEAAIQEYVEWMSRDFEETSEVD